MSQAEKPVGGWTCPCCGDRIDDLPALAFTTPGNYPQLKLWERVRLGSRANDIYIDRKNGYTFVRCVLSLPMIDRTTTLDWGVWCSLSAENFARYRRSYRSRKQSELGPMFGWFSSHCPGYPETFGLKAQVHPQDERQRPLVELDETDHPLSIDQRNGITFERALHLAAPWLRMLGHDLAPNTDAT
jgi:hypothetical protein